VGRGASSAGVDLIWWSMLFVEYVLFSHAPRSFTSRTAVQAAYPKIGTNIK